MYTLTITLDEVDYHSVGDFYGHIWNSILIQYL